MGRQLISVGVGMRVVPGRKSVLLLGMMRDLWMGMVHGMMLVLFTVPIFIRACLGPGKRIFWIPRLAIWSVSWRHSYNIRSMLLKQSRCGGGKHLILGKISSPAHTRFMYSPPMRETSENIVPGGNIVGISPPVPFSTRLWVERWFLFPFPQPDQVPFAIDDSDKGPDSIKRHFRTDNLPP